MKNDMNRTIEYWDKRADGYRKNAASDYEVEFLGLAGLRDGETFFDMGCASGTLAIPLAEKGHRVLACDFSESMLDMLKEDAKERELLDRIDVRLLDWNEDWTGRELYPCDVAVASRSFFAEDVAAGVEKLDRMAKRRVIITSPEGRPCQEIIRVLEKKEISHVCIPMKTKEKNSGRNWMFICWDK